MGNLKTGSGWREEGKGLLEEGRGPKVGLCPYVETGPRKRLGSLMGEDRKMSLRFEVYPRQGVGGGNPHTGQTQVPAQ